MAQHMDYDTLHNQFETLALQEKEHLGKLDETIFKMGDLLNEANPDDEELERLAKEWGYSIVTLQNRRDVSRNIKKEERNSNLSWSAHSVTVKMRNREERNNLIKKGNVSAAEMTVAVQKKRQELGEIKPSRNSPYSVDNLRKLNFAGGLDISDGTNVVKVRATIIRGKVQITIDSDHPRVGKVAVDSIANDTKQIIEYELGDDYIWQEDAGVTV